jgi:WD40 repeat protein
MGTRFAEVGTSTSVSLWEIDSQRLLERLRSDRGYVYGLAFSGDGRILATGHRDNITFWDVGSRSKLGIGGTRGLCGDVGLFAR